jgi:uncharacterized protein (UPF0179 family)
MERTPEEIKMGLECCYVDLDLDCTECPYKENMCHRLEKDAFYYICQLEAQVKRLEKDVQRGRGEL